MKYHQEINLQLKRHFGHGANGKPNFRLVWSEDMTEMQTGDFVERTLSGVIVRKVKGTFRVPKYNYIKDRWIIERNTPEQKLCDDVKNGDGFEPIWTFSDKDGNYYMPHWPECQYIVKRFIEIMTRPESQRRTEKDTVYDMELNERLEVKQAFEEMFGNDTDQLDGKFRDGSAILIHKEG